MTLEYFLSLPPAVRVDLCKNWYLLNKISKLEFRILLGFPWNVA